MKPNRSLFGHPRVFLSDSEALRLASDRFERAFQGGASLEHTILFHPTGKLVGIARELLGGVATELVQYITHSEQYTALPLCDHHYSEFDQVHIFRGDLAALQQFSQLATSLLNAGVYAASRQPPACLWMNELYRLYHYVPLGKSTFESYIGFRLEGEIDQKVQRTVFANLQHFSNRFGPSIHIETEGNILWATMLVRRDPDRWTEPWAEPDSEVAELERAFAARLSATPEVTGVMYRSVSVEQNVFLASADAVELLLNRQSPPKVPQNNLSKPVSPQEGGSLLGVSSRTFVRWVKDGRIRAKKISSKSYQIHLDDLPKTDRR